MNLKMSTLKKMTTKSPRDLKKCYSYGTKLSPTSPEKVTDVHLYWLVYLCFIIQFVKLQSQL